MYGEENRKILLYVNNNRHDVLALGQNLNLDEDFVSIIKKGNEIFLTQRARFFFH